MKYRVISIVIGLVLIFDQLSKWAIVKRFRFHESLHFIPDFFAFTYVHNTGAAFSMLHDAPEKFREPFFLIVPMVILIGLSVYLYRLASERKLAIFGVSLIIGGAIGNLIDRVRLGYVIDFIHVHWKNVYHYPMFNIADSAIVIGVGLLFIETFLYKEPKTK